MWSVGCIFAGEAAWSRRAVLYPAGRALHSKTSSWIPARSLDSHACGMHSLQFQEVSGVGWDDLSTMSCWLWHDWAKPRLSHRELSPCSWLCPAELLVGKPIFNGSDEMKQLDKITSVLGTPTEETMPGVSKLQQ